MVLADHRNMIPDHRHNLQSPGEQVVPALAVVETAQHGIAVRPEEDSPAFEKAWAVRLEDLCIRSVQDSPGQRHAFLVENSGEVVWIHPEALEEWPYAEHFLSEQPPGYAPGVAQARSDRLCKPISRPRLRRPVPFSPPLMPRDFLWSRVPGPGIQQHHHFHLAALPHELMGRLEGHQSGKRMSCEHTGGSGCMSVERRDIRSNHLLHGWKTGRAVGSHRIAPCQGPRYVDAEYRVLLAHSLREAELDRSGVNEIYGKFSASLSKLNHRCLSLALCLLSIDQLCYLPHSRIPEKLRRAQTDLMPSVDFADQPDDHHGIAAQVEEVVLDPHLLEPENLRPDAGQDLLGGFARCSVGALKAGGKVRHRQRLTVDLAVRRQRQRIEPHELGWDHVLGQRGAEERAQLIHEVGGRVVGDYVGDQALVPRGVLA